MPLYAAYGRPTAQLEAQRSLGVPLDGAVLRISELKFVGRVFDVTTAAGQRTAGVSREALTGDSYEPCHELADFVRRRYPEADAVRVPSAADGAGVNLVVWHDRVAVTLTVVRSELVVVTFDDRA